jgi:hypothetical protein
MWLCAFGFAGMAQQLASTAHAVAWERKQQWVPELKPRPVAQGGASAASALFGGALRSEVRAAGAPASATLEPCFLVHLDIQPEGVACVQDALAAFTQPETIHGVAPGVP